MSVSPLFWVLALALVGATLALLVVPLLRRGAIAETVPDESATTAIFRDHKRQIEAAFAANAITAAQRDEALAELTKRFGNELAQAKPAPAPAAHERTRFVAALALVACVPVIAAALYFSLGNPAAIDVAKSPHGTDAANDPQIV